MPAVFLHCSPYFSRQDFSLNLEFTDSAGLVIPMSSGILSSDFRRLELQACAAVPGFKVGVGMQTQLALNTANTSPTDPSPYSPNLCS